MFALSSKLLEKKSDRFFLLGSHTVSEFAQELGAAMESHSANVRRLVDEFRSRSGDSRIDVGGLRRVWESLLRQVEADAASHLDLAAVLQQQLSRPTLEASFHRKLQSRKVSCSRGRFFINLHTYKTAKCAYSAIKYKITTDKFYYKIFIDFTECCPLLTDLLLLRKSINIIQILLYTLYNNNMYKLYISLPHLIFCKMLTKRSIFIYF